MQDSPAAKGWMRRGFLGIPLVAWLVAATATTAIAVIGIVVFMGMTGTVTTGDGIDITYTANAALTTETNSLTGTCEASATATEIALDIQDMDPYNYCYIEVEVNNAGPGVARLQVYDSAMNDGGTGTTGINPSLNTTSSGGPVNYCGTTIAAGGTATVGFQIDFRSDLVPSQTYIITPAGDGLTFVRSNLYDGGVCF